MNAFDRRVWGRLRSGLAHAFALHGQPDQFDEDDLALLDRFARLLADRGLATPAIFFVESLAPLGFLGSQLVHALTPIMGILASRDDIEQLARLLERREAPAIFADRLRSLDSALRSFGRAQRRLRHSSGQARFDRAQRRPFVSAQDRLRPGTRQDRQGREGEADRP